MGWGQEIGLHVSFELQNVSFSTERKVDGDQTCVTGLYVDLRN